MMSRDGPDTRKPDTIAFRPNILTFHKAFAGWSFGSTNYSPRRMWRLLDSMADDTIEQVGREVRELALQFPLYTDPAAVVR